MQQSGLLNRRLELLQRDRIHVAARLVRVGMDLADGKLDQAAFALGFVARGTEQGFEPAAQATTSCRCVGHAGTSGSGSMAAGAGAPARSTRRISSCATAR